MHWKFPNLFFFLLSAVAQSEEEMQKQDMVDGVLQDIHVNWGKMVYMAKDFVSVISMFHEQYMSW